MPYSRKTLSTLISEVATDLNTSLAGADALLRFTVLKVVGKIMAALTNGLYGYLDWIAKQAVPFTAEDEYLQGWAALKNVTLKEPTAAVLQLGFTGTAGKTMDAGLAIVRSDGVTYTTNATATVDSTGALSVSATADDAGSGGNADAGTAMTLSSTIDGIAVSGVVTGTVSSGADTETNDALRTRMLAAFQQTPQGGSSADYEGWALAIAGVTRAWVAPNNFGPGTVVIYTMFDVAEATNGGFPQGTNGVSQNDKGPQGVPRGVVATGDLLVVADSIVTKQPVTALVYSCSPLPNSLTFTISGLTSASSATRTAISASISDVLYRNGSPLGGTVNISDIQSSIDAIAGTSGNVITLVQGVQAGETVTYPGNITSAFGYLPVLANVIYS